MKTKFHFQVRTYMLMFTKKNQVTCTTQVNFFLKKSNILKRIKYLKETIVSKSKQR